MIQKCVTESTVMEILNYIGDEFKLIPYLYVDVVKYGTGAPQVQTWVDRDSEGNLRGVYLFYYDCLHFFTRDAGNYPVETLVNAVEFLNPKVIMTQEHTGMRLENALCDSYALEKICIIDFENVVPDENETACELASRDDIHNIVDMMMTEDIFTSVYDRDILEKQMLERYDDQFSHYFVIRDGEKLVAAYTTFAEIPHMILFGSIIVNSAYKGRGYAGRMIKYACQFFAGNDAVKLTCINVTNTASLRAHEKIGAVPVGTLYKFVKK